MSPQLPRNRRLSQTGSRQTGSGRSERTPGRLRLFFRRIGQVVWPERFPREIGERRSVKPRGFIWVWGLAVTLAVVAFVAHLHVRFQIIETGYALSQAQAEQRRLRLAQRELRLELATLKEPGRIEQQARERLGMEPPEHDRIIRLGQSPRLARRR